jgi:uncharacterized protein YxjI
MIHPVTLLQGKFGIPNICSLYRILINGGHYQGNAFKTIFASVRPANINDYRTDRWAANSIGQSERTKIEERFQNRQAEGMNELQTTLQSGRTIEIQQRHELAELFGFETRNKYEIRDEGGRPIGFAAEQQKGFWNFIVRQFFGHWRLFDILFFDLDKRPILQVKNRFRWLFQYVEVTYIHSDGRSGESLGALEQRFAIFSKRFDVQDENGRAVMQMRSPIWRIWTFTFFKNDQPVAVIEKKWAGLLSEAFTDRDRFRLKFDSPNFSEKERWLLLAASLFVDLNYFENKAK